MSRKPIYTREELLSAVDSATSMVEVLRRLGKTSNSGNYQTLQNYAKRYDIQLPRCVGGHTDMAILKNTRTLDEILVEHSTYNNTTNLKARLLREGILDNVCAVDKTPGWWNGNLMNLVLDHINGDRTDNRLSNLRLLCPNCNSQQDTFCRGKRKAKQE